MSELVVGSNSIKLSFPSTSLPILTIGSGTYTANSAGQCVVKDQILAAGGIILNPGIIISLAPSASALVIGTLTR